MLRPGQVLFTYLHLAAYPEEGHGLVASGATAIAYETVQLTPGPLPLLAPMSEIAGRMATQAGAHHLERPQGGRGVLIGGVSGVPPGRVTVLGAGQRRHQRRPHRHGHGRRRHHPRPQRRPAPGHRRTMWGRITTVRSSVHAVDEYVPRPIWSSVRSWSPAPAPRWWSPGSTCAPCAPAPSSSTSPSTRVGASPPPGRRRTPTRRTWSTTSSTTPWGTSPEPCRTPLPTPCPTPPSPTWWRWPRASARPPPATRS